MYGEYKTCPKCEAKGVEQECIVYSRIVGYLRPINQWNDGKAAEFKDRKLFDKETDQLEKSEEIIQKEPVVIES